MEVVVCRWPLKEVHENNRLVRTKEPTAYLKCFVDKSTLGVRGIVHLKFPGLMGWYDFRLSTGRCTLEKMKDYVIDKVSLVELREERDRLKEEKKT